jgi:hypothetical protein
MATNAPSYRLEYVSGVFWLDQITDTTFSYVNVWLTNRGRTTETFKVVFNYVDAGGQGSFAGDAKAVPPGGISGHGWTAEADPGVVAYESLWVHVLVTSRDLVPSIAYGLEHPTGPVFHNGYLSPGDFMVFDIHDVPHLPTPPIGPSES